jgi:hypothetical protein
MGVRVHAQVDKAYDANGSRGQQRKWPNQNSIKVIHNSGLIMTLFEVHELHSTVNGIDAEQ